MMSEKYLITWNAGWGQNEEVVECNSLEEAEEAAYEAWKQEVENQADYNAQVLTQELAEEYDFEDELE
jgi:hypothetical protein